MTTDLTRPTSDRTAASTREVPGGVTVARVGGATRRLLWVVWGLTSVVLAGLAVFIVRHLATGQTGAAMSGMDMGAMHDGGHDIAEEVFAAGADPVGNTLLSTRLFTAWQLDSTAVALVVVLAAAYVTGLLLARRRTPGFRWPTARLLALIGALAAIVVATCGSIAVYDRALFSAHMLGHLTLVMLAPALLAAARPLTLWRSALRDPQRFDRILTGRVLSVLISPPVAFACYTVVLIGTHLTGLMDVIMTNVWAGQLEHLAYLLVGYQFFLLVIGDEPIRWRLSLLGRLGLLAVAMAVDTFTGVVLLMSTVPISMAAATDALGDTRTGGAIMWVGGDGLMAVIMVLLVLAYLRAPHTGRREENSWLERVRRSTFDAHTGSTTATTPTAAAPATTRDTGAADDMPAAGAQPALDFDEDDRRREAYNQWLARLQDSHR